MTTLYHPGDRPDLALQAFHKHGAAPMTVMASPAEYRDHWQNTCYPPAIKVVVADPLCINTSLQPNWLNSFDAVESHDSNPQVLAVLESFRRTIMDTPQEFLINLGHALYGETEWIAALARDLEINHRTLGRMVSGRIPVDWSHGVMDDARHLAKERGLLR